MMHPIAAGAWHIARLLTLRHDGAGLPSSPGAVAVLGTLALAMGTLRWSASMGALQSFSSTAFYVLVLVAFLRRRPQVLSGCFLISATIDVIVMTFTYVAGVSVDATLGMYPFVAELACLGMLIIRNERKRDAPGGLQ